LAQINQITHNIVKNQQTNFLTSNNTNPVSFLYPPKPKCRNQQTHFLTSNNTTAVRILYPPDPNCRNDSLQKHSYIRSIFAYTNPFTFRINNPQQHLGLREHRFWEQQHIKMAFQSRDENIRQ